MKSKRASPDGIKKKPKVAKKRGIVGPHAREAPVSAIAAQDGDVRPSGSRSAVKLTQQQLEAHLWGAANILRGKTAGQDYKNYILSLMFYKRLCDQWENEADEAIAELEQQQGRAFGEKEKAIFRKRGEH